MSENTRQVSDQSSRPAVRPLPGKLLGELVLPVGGGHDELLKHRFLCQKGGCLLVGPTGIGKSVLALQAATKWSVGKAFAGIEPARPLVIWIIAAEDSEGEIAQQRDGILGGLQQDGILTAEECALARRRVRIVAEVAISGEDFGEWLRGALQNARNADTRPDLIVIDPALSFLGGDAGAQVDVTRFLRGIITPILVEFGVGALVMHHPGKPAPASHTRNRADANLDYLALGSVEWANWPRSILVLAKTETRGLYVLHAAKGGHKLRWRNPVTNEPVYQRYIAHSSDGRIYWREADGAVIAAAQASHAAGSSAKCRVTVENVVRLADVPRGKADFEEHIETELKIGRDKARNLIRACIDRKLLEQVDLKSFPRQTLIGLPGATAAAAARRAAGAGAATAPAVACLSPAAPAACPPAAAPTAPAARPKRLQI